MSLDIEFRSLANQVSLVLEQIKPDMCLISSRADEPLILLCQEFSEYTPSVEPTVNLMSCAFLNEVELSGGQCQVRPHREFVAQKGCDKLQQLRILSELPRSEVHSTDDRHFPSSTPRNANEFMNARRHTGDPTAQRLNASIRLLNFGCDRAPLCVRSDACLKCIQLKLL